MARDCGGPAVFLEADSPFMIRLGQAERPGGHTAGTYRPGLEGTQGRSISADPCCRWVHRASASCSGASATTGHHLVGGVSRRVVGPPEDRFRPEDRFEDDRQDLSLLELFQQR